MSSVNIYKSKTYCLVSAFSADANDFTSTVEHLLVDGGLSSTKETYK